MTDRFTRSGRWLARTHGRQYGINVMVERTQGPRSKFLQGGRVEDSGSFPEDGLDYRDMTPGERMEALRRLSRRAFTCIPGDDVRRRLQGLPDRLVGGRR